MKSSCKITFSGLNVNRLLNQFCKVGVPLLGVERNGKTCIIYVAKKHCNKVVALLKEKCYNIDKIEYNGSLAIFDFCKKRCFLCAFLIVAILAVYLLSNFCLKIEVYGDFDRAIVLQALEEAGIKQGVSVSGLNVDQLENDLAVKLDAMYAVVTRKGASLYINAVKRKTVEPPIDIHSKRNIVATTQGKVLSVLCEQGTPLVTVGDYVNAGDVLILGERQFADGSYESAYALGRIVLEVYATGFAEFNGTKTVTERTGNFTTVYGVKLFKTTYVNGCKYPSYETETSSTFLSPLNLEIVKITYYETQNVTVSAALDECKTELAKKAEEIAKSNCGFEVLNTQINVKTNGVEVVLVGQCEIR